MTGNSTQKIQLSRRTIVSVTDWQSNPSTICTLIVGNINGSTLNIMYESIMRLVPGRYARSSYAHLPCTLQLHLVHEYRTAAAVKEITTYCAAPDLTEGA
ncbi:hypothetical protein IAQ61_002915 [Plenodomus lingam]|uniref:uncharacterized protein n=1 Tax=Leptosphaeria maculans TaxID=5022 RepID=UPI003329586F|nr:hypothetical protein IAQ61_002915 [Plenodomus lingam]